MHSSNTVLQVQDIINNAVTTANESCCGNCFFYYNPLSICRLLVNSQGEKALDNKGKNGYLVVKPGWLCEHWESFKKKEKKKNV